MTSPVSSADPVEAIGGYFELELAKGSFPHADAILLNSGRSCIEYVLRANDVRHVYVPNYTCDVVLQPLDRLGIAFSFYAINEQLELSELIELRHGELLIVNNYFGIKDEYCRRLAEIYGRQLAIDCSQAFFADPPAGSHCFYTPRKFFGVPDGGCLYTDERLDLVLETDHSYSRSIHLLKRIDLGAEMAYAEFRKNDASLNGEAMKWLSPLTRRLLGAIDYSEALRRRRSNFALLNDHLGVNNRLRTSTDNACPMVFPLVTDDPDLRQRLIQNRIFVPLYWPNVLNWCEPRETAYHVATHLLPLPIDQRYGPEHMARILEILT